MVSSLIRNNQNLSYNSTTCQIRQHVLVFLIYLFFMPIGAALTGIIGSISPISAVSAIYIITSVLATLKLKRELSRSSKLVLCYFIYSFISLLWGGITTRWYITNLLLNMATFVLGVTDSYNNCELKAIKKSVALSVVLTIVVALICQIKSTENRLIITIFSSIDPNEFSESLCFCIAFLLSSISVNKHKVLPLVGVVCCAAIIVLTGSRGGLLSFGVIFILWFILYGGKQRFRILLIVALVILLAFILFFNKIGSFLFDRLNIFKSLADDGGAGRLKIWTAAIESFNDANLIYKLFGHGYGAFVETVNYIAPGHSSAYMAHNMWIDCLITGGVLGILFLLLAFASSFIYAYKNKNIWGVLCLTSFLISSMSIDTQFYKTFSIVLIVALIGNKGKSNVKY